MIIGLVNPQVRAYRKARDQLIWDSQSTLNALLDVIEEYTWPSHPIQESEAFQKALLLTGRAEEDDSNRS